MEVGKMTMDDGTVLALDWRVDERSKISMALTIKEDTLLIPLEVWTDLVQGATDRLVELADGLAEENGYGYFVKKKIDKHDQMFG